MSGQLLFGRLLALSTHERTPRVGHDARLIECGPRLHERTLRPDAPHAFGSKLLLNLKPPEACLGGMGRGGDGGGRSRGGY